MLHPTEEPIQDARCDSVNPNVGSNARGCRFSLRSILIAVLMFALLLGLGPMVLKRVFFGTGPVWSSSRWPRELTAFLDELPESARENVSDVKVYCIYDGFDTAHVWRFNLPHEEYDSLKLSFETADLPTLDPSGFWEQPPRWWDPDPKVDADYVEWFGFNTTVVTMYDKKTEVLYGYSQNDF